MTTTIATAGAAAQGGRRGRGDPDLVGAFISLKVAATIAGAIVDAGVITPIVVFGGLIGAHEPSPRAAEPRRPMSQNAQAAARPYAPNHASGSSGRSPSLATAI